MPLLETFALSIGVAIAKYLAKSYFGDSLPEKLAGAIADASKDELKRILARPSDGKHIDAPAEKVANKIRGVLEGEVRLSKDDRERLALEVAITLAKAQIDAKLLVDYKLDHEKLLRHLENARPNATSLLSADDSNLYQRLLREASSEILKVSTEMAGFVRYLSASTLQSDEQILNAVQKLLARPSVEAERFEKDYRDLVVKYLDEMDIFGVPRMKRLRHSQSLSVAYLTLSAEWDGQAEGAVPWFSIPPEKFMQALKRAMEPVEMEGVGLVPPIKRGVVGEVVIRKERYTGDVDKLLGQPAHLVLCGDAGSGKTTLLRWIAVQCAAQKFTDDLSFLNHLVPFYIRLRDYVGKLETLKPEEFIEHVATDLSGKMPHGWVHEQLESGRALVLIDGVDELPKSQREEMRERLARWVKTFGLARFIVSSRTYALNQNDFPEWWEWINNENFIQATLQKMNADQTDHFVDHWYGALDASLNDKEKRELKDYPANLKSQLRRTPPLRQLAETPLLCAMICALHREYHRRLPSRRNDLYKECIEMILSKRDEEREIEHTEEYPDLTLSQKIQLAEDFAERLMLNNLSEDDVVNADKCFADAFSSLNITEVTAENVRHFFVKRANLLREPVVGRIEFAHRTFEEYLAAQRLMKRNYVGVLVEHALNDQWRETIILAAGIDSHPKEANELLAKILQKGVDETDQKAKRRCYLLAIACLAMMVRVEEATLREKVLERAKTILPPKNNDEAELIAYAGDPLVPFLADKPDRSIEEATMCIDILTLIGTDKAMGAIGDYAARYTEWGKHLEIQFKIGSGSNSFDFSTYVERVFARTPIVILVNLPLRNVSVLKQLTHLNVLILFNISMNDVSMSDVRLLKELTQLERLWLDGTPMSDVSMLKDLKNLIELSLSGTRVSDVSMLKDLKNLMDLNLSGTRVNDVTALEELPNLVSLNLRGTRVNDVSALKDLPQLQLLFLSDTQVSDVSALKDLKSLVGLRLNKTPVSEVSALKELSNLWELDLSNTQVNDISALKDLSQLQTLSLNNTRVSDVSALKDLKNLKTLNLDNTSVSDISALKDLSQVQFLSLDNTQVSDISALKDLRSLETLHLDNTPVSDVGALQDLPKLKMLRLDNTQVSDVSALKDLPNLMELHLDNTPVRDVSAFEGKKGLNIFGVKKRND